jgi:hypothetical protein
MKGTAVLAAALAILAGEAKANFVAAPTFQENMALAQLVVIGTVTAIDRGGPRGSGSTATLSVLQRLKGESPDAITVGTYNRVDELDPRCCEVGATYLMFLRPSATDGGLVSTWGSYGMIRIGAPRPASVATRTVPPRT